MYMPVNAFYTQQPMEYSGSHSRTMPAMPAMSVQLRSSPVKRVKFLVIFDWDDTLFPTTALRVNQGKSVAAIDLYNLGQSVYTLLGKYITSFGTDNLCIVTNGRQPWVLDSLKILSDLYQACFEGMDDATEQKEQKEKGQDYFAAIYNTLVSSHHIPIIYAQDEYATRYPQVMSLPHMYLSIYGQKELVHEPYYYINHVHQ